MKKILIGTAFVVALCAIGVGVWYWPTYQAHEQVRSQLVDPSSAKFGDIVISKKSKSICGSVNARNRMGGYTGFTSFILFADGELRFEPSDSGGYTTQEKLDSVNKQINWLNLLIANCPELKEKDA